MVQDSATSRFETSMNVLEVIKQVLKKVTLCDNCLGRQYGLLGHGLDNKTRGRAIKNTLCLQLHLDYKITSKIEYLDALTDLAINGKHAPSIALLQKLGRVPEEKNSSCSICGDLFEKIDDFVPIALQKVKDIEFKTFLVGSVGLEGLIEKEDQIRANFKLQHGESIKGELNREIGKRLLSQLPADKEVDFGNPNIFIIVDYLSKDVLVKINPIFISGRYCKYVRTIPQTKWLCRECRGKGCDRCNGTGKQYQTSVSELIGNIILEHTKGTDFKFHGAGREDIDALMLGEGRQFVIEIKEPKKRYLDYEMLEREINERAEGKIEVKDLKPSDKATVHRLKMNASTARKTYRALVELGSPTTPEKLKALEEHFKDIMIKQQTPTRVLHRRVDKIRTKKVYSIKARIESDALIELIIFAQGGTYIKELISGDSGRSSPSIAEFLQTTATVKKLDVLAVESK
ncbi:MAG: tRNA pseudouridine(54/55) synthase Pus10 [Candidatus Helarchaeales archaeon]